MKFRTLSAFATSWAKPLATVSAALSLLCAITLTSPVAHALVPHKVNY